MSALVMPYPPARLFVRGREPEERTTPLARWLTEARVARGWSMRDLEAKADVSQARISQIESGGDAPVKMLERLAQALVPEGLDAGEAEESYRRLRQQAIRAAFLPDEEHEYSDEPDDYIDTVTREIGYSDVMLSPEAKRKARESLETTIMGLVEQEKRERQISETAKFKARQAQAQKKQDGKKGDG